MKENKKHLNFTIVGAGISGLTAALVIKALQPKAKVSIVDAAPRPGGLLKSVSYEYDGTPLHFDLGTHIPELTQNDSLNQIVFPKKVKDTWHALNQLKVGNFHDQQLNPLSQFINIPTTHPQFNQALKELLETSSKNVEYFESLEASLNARYGPSLTEHLFKPLIFKMTGADLNQLVPETVKFYGLSRVSMGNQLISENLKKIPQLDEVLAYFEDQHHLRDSMWVYPGDNGVGEWVAFMYEKCLKAGVEFLFGEKIYNVQKVESGYALTLNSGKRIDTEKLIWTLPFYVGFEGADQTKFNSRSIAIYHFASKAPLLLDQHYIYCQDASMKSYRVTLYNNVYKSKHTLNKVTVEVIFDCTPPTEQTIREELVTMGVFSKDAIINHLGTTEIPYGFPVPLLANQETQKKLYEKVRSENPQVIFAGRGQQGIFFTTDVLLNVYETLRQHLTGME